MGLASVYEAFVGARVGCAQRDSLLHRHRPKLGGCHGVFSAPGGVFDRGCAYHLGGEAWVVLDEGSDGFRQLHGIGGVGVFEGSVEAGGVEEDFRVCARRVGCFVDGELGFGLGACLLFACELAGDVLNRGGRVFVFAQADGASDFFDELGSGFFGGARFGVDPIARVLSAQGVDDVFQLLGVVGQARALNALFWLR